MFRNRCVILVLCLSLLNLTYCTRTATKVPMLADVDGEATFDIKKVTGVVTKRGETIEFDKPKSPKSEWGRERPETSAGGAVVLNDTLRAYVNQFPYSIALDDIATVQVEELDTQKTVLATLGAAAIFAGVGVLILYASWELY